MPKCLQIMCAKYYELRCMFYKKTALVKVGAFAWYSVKIRVIFAVRFERQKVDKKSKPTQKLKHANSILEPFEYFCQISWKSIVIILSYTVSKLERFLRHSVCLYSMFMSRAQLIHRWTTFYANIRIQAPAHNLSLSLGYGQQTLSTITRQLMACGGRT